MSADSIYVTDQVVTNTVDIIIVGCGPTGATLGLLLEQCGISSLILEREHAVYPLPRAVHFDDHIMRVFQTLGVAEEVSAVARYNPGMRFVDPQNNLLVDWPRPPGIGENGWYSSYRFHQPDLENILRDKISSGKLIELKTGVNVTKVENDPGYATVSCLNDQNGAEHYQARYVVGCDGANSIVRNVIGQEVDDFGFNEHWLVIDTLLKRDKPELGDYTIQHCGRHRPATYVRCPGLRRRWEMALMPDEERTELVKEEVLWDLLSDWITPIDADIERSAIYEFKSQVSRQWRSGRLLIAGDAAHLTPPFMGQGMCAGIRDAANLAWKLAECCREEAKLSDASEAESSVKINRLVESYQNERIANVKEYIQTAIALGELINSCSTGLPQDDVEADSDTVKMKSIVPRLGEGLGASQKSSVCGLWFHQPRLRCGKLLDDVVTYKPVLIVEPALWLTWSDRLPPTYTVLVTDEEVDLQSCLDAYDVSALLVRPDRYILGGASNVEELEALICLSGDLGW